MFMGELAVEEACFAIWLSDWDPRYFAFVFVFVFVFVFFLAWDVHGRIGCRGSMFCNLALRLGSALFCHQESENLQKEDEIDGIFSKLPQTWNWKLFPNPRIYDWRFHVRRTLIFSNFPSEAKLSFCFTFKTVIKLAVDTRFTSFIISFCSQGSFLSLFSRFH